ncbi:MAG TPA: exodeoxyribonuclease III [Candidatus Baltobacteraceae bacterium]|jgi:exodeoxyribonuclease-3
MRITTLNANGIRSAARKGFYAWMDAQDADVVCLQETKAQEHQLPFEALAVQRYCSAFVDAEKRGYSGVAIYSKRQPDRIVRGLGWPEFDREGRYVQFDFGALSIGSLYVPSGSSGEVRQAVKAVFLELLEAELQRKRADGRSYIIAGDFNVAHRDIDVFDPSQCAGVSGFFPQERRWMDRVLAPSAWVDAFRVADPNPRRYTWWSNFRQAFERDRGWRIDYQLTTPDVGERVRGSSIYRDARFSDHAPVTIDYELS